LTRATVVRSRNYVVAALARYLNDHFKDSPHLTLRYGHKLNFVDAERTRVHVRASDGVETYVPYDLLIGADGVRSGVRAALVAHHRDFELSVHDIFERFKSVHVDLPKGMENDAMHVYPSCARAHIQRMLTKPTLAYCVCAWHQQWM
jgi:2-polyprenyl-6-methoxyphenol hydroxylase-like FAD-dependent oxidoreductase